MGQPTAEVIGFGGPTKGASSGGKKYVYKHAHLARDHQFLVRNCLVRTVRYIYAVCLRPHLLAFFLLSVNFISGAFKLQQSGEKNCFG